MVDPSTVLAEVRALVAQLEARLTVDLPLPTLRRIRDALVHCIPAPEPQMLHTIKRLDQYGLRDTIWVSELIELFEHLEATLQAAHAACGTDVAFEGWVASIPTPEGNPWDADAKAYREVQAVLRELEGSGADLQWRDAWYPAELIPDLEFTNYVRAYTNTLLDAFYRDLPDWVVLDWTATADNLRLNYSEVELCGRTYLVELGTYG